ncbi:CcdB family protein [Paracandidimonas soli]|uniref:Toxin CcdB n=1 Tax=Paracandidimonas soli TaxID=1917182 RepID=A0A4R3UQW8_9BURK|nr:CcdB family protein [Paracandidimonas soli]TCU92983.1 toxin CcdB [Paracandidimonas soli]
MSRYDVYPNPSGFGYLLDVQADILQQMSTRAVVPLLPVSKAPKPAKTLNPVFDIAGEPHVMVTQYLAAVPERELQTPACGLQHRNDDIVAAVDFLFHGF